MQADARSGSTASAGSRTSSRVMSHWIDARIDSFGSIGVAVKPGVSVGTTNPRIPSSVCAQMTATSAIDASPIHRFAPVSTQSVPSRAAQVVMLAGSLPAVGFGEPEAADQLARGHAGQPLLLLLLGAVLVRWRSSPASPARETKVRRPESPASSSSAARPYSTALRPAQP